MARITGKDLYLIFASTVLDTDFQSWEYSDEMNLVEVTAGDDSAAAFAATYTNGKGSYKGLFDTTNGTAQWSAITNGTSGTIIWGPRGTASGYPKYTVPAICQSRTQSIPFAGAIELGFEFQFTAAVTPSTW